MKCPLLLDLKKNFHVSKNLRKLLTIKLHENQFNCSRVVTREQTEVSKSMEAFRHTFVENTQTVEVLMLFWIKHFRDMLTQVNALEW